MNRRGRGKLRGRIVGRKKKRKVVVDRQGYFKVPRRGTFPMPCKQKPIQTRRIRYSITTARSNIGFGCSQMIYAILATLNSSTTAYPIAEAVRLLKVTLYNSTTGTFGTPGTEIDFRWIDQNLPPVLYTEVGTNNQPAMIKMRPPLNSLASMWYDENNPSFTGAIPWFEFSAPVGGILDIDYQYIIGEGTQVPMTLTAVGPNGIAYLEPLLGTLTPFGLSSTVISTTV